MWQINDGFFACRTHVLIDSSVDERCIGGSMLTG
jgi:hypothetical protein